MKRKRNRIAESFIAHSKEMRESPAWRHLPDNARRVLDRLELEHMRNGGAENGRLIVTHSQFAEAGIRRASVALAIRQCVRLGFLEIVESGGRAISGFRAPSLYRLTYLFGTRASAPKTDDWRQIVDEAAAQAALERAAQERNLASQAPSTLRMHDERRKQKAGRAIAS